MWVMALPSRGSHQGVELGAEWGRVWTARPLPPDRLGCLGKDDPWEPWSLLWAQLPGVWEEITGIRWLPVGPGAAQVQGCWTNWLPVAAVDVSPAWCPGPLRRLPGCPD